MWSIATQKLLDEDGKILANEHRELIRKRVNDLKDEICALHLLHNTIAPINRLPPEILSRILVQSSDECRQDSLSWIQATHTCHHWRMVALDCAALWSDISFVNPAFTKVMLARSKNAPLHVDLRTSYTRTTPVIYEALSEVLDQGSRLRSIAIDNVTNSRRSGRLHLRRFLSKCYTAPILEELRLHTSMDHCLSSTFLRGGSPTLKHLELSGCVISNWNTIPFGTALLTLNLARSRIQVNENLSGSGFISLLQNVPSLENLHVRFLLPRGLYSQSPAAAPFTHSKLRTLELIDYPENIERFLRAVHVPNAENITLDLDDDVTFRYGYPDLTTLFGALQSSWHKVVSAGIGELRVSSDELSYGTPPSHSFWFKFNNPASTASIQSPYTLDLRRVQIANLEAEAVILAAEECWGMLELQVLDLDTDAEMSFSTWEVMWGLPKLQDITTVGPLFDDLFQFLIEEHIYMEEDPGTPISPFPALSSLTVEDAALSPEELYQWEIVFGNRPEHAPNLKVTLSQCSGLTKKMLEDTTALVGPRVEIVWEGQLDSHGGAVAIWDAD
ncbi:hypothetical protein DFP72DRAFT_1167560 [Ephemerocybe angulata]|uniref:F-box domain-containing protein n=1 Tax=Ephemerocybe angulata TaxID=980116 RepID=A0A8H6MAM2_9AGAR|nr:hypothetical protein DFP72DRAFT_1167560 [Tulosesus angulatus]